MSKKSKKKSGKFYGFTRWFLGFFLRIVYRIRVTGAENIPDGGAIICANHIGYPDALILGASLPRQVRFLAKAELFRIPLLGSAIRGLGAVSIKRNSADVGAIREIVSLSKAGSLVAVFPQGHRRHGQNPADTEIKNGIGMIAYRSEMPVLPICIKMKKERYALFRRVNIIIGMPVTYDAIVDGHTSEDYALASRAFFRRTCLLGGYTPKLLTEGETAK